MNFYSDSDPNLNIASKRIKLIRTNIHKVLQFIRVNLPSVNGLNLRPNLSFNHLKDDTILQFYITSVSFFSCFS